MPNRIIKESINESRALSELSLFAEDLYKRLITYADDYGRFNADYQIMRARLYPREMEIVSESDIEGALIELSGAGKIAFYTAQPRKEIYGCFPNWADHQRIRDSKNKCPEPDDTRINDWYLRRFIPKSMKKKIIERDGFKCKICGKYVSAVEDSSLLVKMGTGLYHIDHIVPVCQGGRAKEENLRLTCPKCNQGRKKIFSIEEILQECEDDYCVLQKDSANIGKLQKDSAIIQSESNPNLKSNTICSDLVTESEQVLYADVEKIPLNDGAYWQCTVDEFEEFRRLYPSVDIKQEFRNMRGWCLSNPTKKKTSRGIKKFVNGWLQRQQDSGKTQSKQANKFNNFDNRKYDMTNLERQLLNG